jgi:hypothetical protein
MKKGLSMMGAHVGYAWHGHCHYHCHSCLAAITMHANDMQWMEQCITPIANNAAVKILTLGRPIGIPFFGVWHGACCWWRWHLALVDSVNRRIRLFEQGADHARLVQYLKNWIRWAKTGVSLHVKALTLKITEILRNTLHVHVPLKSN